MTVGFQQKNSHSLPAMPRTKCTQGVEMLQLKSLPWLHHSNDPRRTRVLVSSPLPTVNKDCFTSAHWSQTQMTPEWQWHPSVGLPEREEKKTAVADPSMVTQKQLYLRAGWQSDGRWLTMEDGSPSRYPGVAEAQAWGTLANTQLVIFFLGRIMGRCEMSGRSREAEYLSHRYVWRMMTSGHTGNWGKRTTKGRVRETLCLRLITTVFASQEDSCYPSYGCGEQKWQTGCVGSLGLRLMRDSCRSRKTLLSYCLLMPTMRSVICSRHSA